MEFWAKGFNTQPPEGDWAAHRQQRELGGRFNTQPPEGDWEAFAGSSVVRELFQHTAA